MHPCSRSSMHPSMHPQDVVRTFPQHSWARGKQGQDKLRRVLVAFSAHNAVIYCQGMNNVAAFLLWCTEMDDECTFWLLVVLVEKILYQDTYAAQLAGAHVEMRTLAGLIAIKLPKLHKHLKTIECETAVFATDWWVHCTRSSRLGTRPPTPYHTPLSNNPSPQVPLPLQHLSSSRDSSAGVGRFVL